MSKMGMRFTMSFDKPAVIAAMKPKTLRYLRRFGGYVARVARSSIKRKGAARKAPKRKYRGGTKSWTKAYRSWWMEVKERPASPPGSPPFTHTGLLKKAIVFGYKPSTRSVVAGPAHRVVEDTGALHEHGGMKAGRRYPRRAYMQPALEKAKTKQHTFWG